MSRRAVYARVAGRGFSVLDRGVEGCVRDRGVGIWVRDRGVEPCVRARKTTTTVGASDALPIGTALCFRGVGIADVSKTEPAGTAAGSATLEREAAPGLGDCAHVDTARLESEATVARARLAVEDAVGVVSTRPAVRARELEPVAPEGGT